MAKISRIKINILLSIILGGTSIASGFVTPNYLHARQTAPSIITKNLHGTTTRPLRQSHGFKSIDLSTTSINTRLKSTNGDVDYSKLVPKVYNQRWIQLGYLSLLALLSDWICFSVAAAPSTYEAAYAGHSAASLIDIFLFTNVASCFIVTDTVKKFGLEKAIKGASALMALGCFFRSGFGVFGSFLTSLGIGAVVSSDPAAVASATGVVGTELVPFWSILAGTIMVGAAQPFFQCTPPLLSATWFASDERATSTAVALNFNQIGIATAFLIGGEMATSPDGLANYFGVISAVCAVVTLGTFLQFQNKPPTPPSTSEIEKLIKDEEEPPFLESVGKLFKTPGFIYPLSAFIMSISITNIVGTFIDEVMKRGGVTDQFGIDLAGAGFEFGILFGGIIIGGYVDKTKKYKEVTKACIIASLFLLVPLGLTEHSLGQEPVLLILALLGLGMTAGPIQPINAELAVDVSYPSDETAVESIQQVGGNLVSALLVPLVEIAAKQDYELLPQNPSLASDIRGDVVLLLALTTVTYFYFSNFDSPLKRTIADASNGEVGDVIDAEVIQINGKSSSTTGQKVVTKR